MEEKEFNELTTCIKNMELQDVANFQERVRRQRINNDLITGVCGIGHIFLGLISIFILGIDIAFGCTLISNIIGDDYFHIQQIGKLSIISWIWIVWFFFALAPIFLFAKIFSYFYKIRKEKHGKEKLLMYCCGDIEDNYDQSEYDKMKSKEYCWKKINSGFLSGVLTTTFRWEILGVAPVILFFCICFPGHVKIVNVTNDFIRAVGETPVSEYYISPSQVNGIIKELLGGDDNKSVYFVRDEGKGGKFFSPAGYRKYKNEIKGSNYEALINN